MNVIETSGLGKRYGKSWALRECTLALPAGHLAALVGPNGAGKSTLMNMAVGLTVPTSGTVSVLGGQPAGSPAALNGIAFVAQDAPLYKNLSSADMLHLTRNLTGSAAETDSYAAKLSVVQTRRGETQAHLLVRTSGTDDPVPPGWESHPVSLEEVVMAYLRTSRERTPGERTPGERTQASAPQASARPARARPARARPARARPAARCPVGRPSWLVRFPLVRHSLSAPSRRR